jgi:hypothetical protein
VVDDAPTRPRAVALILHVDRLVSSMIPHIQLPAGATSRSKERIIWRYRARRGGIRLDGDRTIDL